MESDCWYLIASLNSMRQIKLGLPKPKIRFKNEFRQKDYNFSWINLILAKSDEPLGFNVEPYPYMGK